MTCWCQPVVMKLGLALSVLTLVGCTTPALSNPLQSADEAPHVALLDETLARRLADAPLKQRGRASWYGKKFNGQRTASGERFSASGFTAAHRTLPFLSYVRVRRVASGEEVIVRITDRGPFHPGRVLDLSHAAAEKIGLVALGSAEVEIEHLTEHDRRLGNSP